MNCYDFDQTIFFPDSSYCFVMYCLRRWPRAVLRALPGTLVLGAKNLLHLSDSRALKQQVFSFLRDLDDVDGIVEAFWEENFERGIAAWYLRNRREDDLILSASPEFLLRPAAERLGVRLIATRMDRHTGEIIGKNCHDHEKVTRFYRDYPRGHVDCFYSDSFSDSPMVRIADAAVMVRDRETLIPWPERGGRP